jgi:hypothetical protein
VERGGGRTTPGDHQGGRRGWCDHPRRIWGWPWPPPMSIGGGLATPDWHRGWPWPPPTASGGGRDHPWGAPGVVAATPDWHRGWPGHPRYSSGVAKATPKFAGGGRTTSGDPLGGRRGWCDHPRVPQWVADHPNGWSATHDSMFLILIFFFFFFLNLRRK